MPDSIALLAEGISAEKLGLLDRALAAFEEAAAFAGGPDVEAEALTRQADILRLQCEWDRALATAQRARDVAGAASLSGRYAQALNAEASVHIARGDLDESVPLLEQMVHTVTDPRLRGIGLQNLGSVYAQRGDLDAAEAAFAESFACFRECGYERGQAIALNNQGRAALDRGDMARATHVLEEAVQAARRVEDGELIALSMTNMSEATLATKDYQRAHDLVCTALGHFRNSGNRWREVECLRLLGKINDMRGYTEEAVRCYERALQLARSIDARLEVAMLVDRLARTVS